MTTNISQTSTGLMCRRKDGTNVSRTFDAFVAAGRNIYHQMARKARIRADRHRLLEMPDHILKDIGIARSEIDFAVNNGREIDRIRDFGRLPG